MPITASCGNCGKTYQAPDRMAGKSVRCKQCGEIFRIDAADTDSGLPDFDALEHSVSGEDLGTFHGTKHGTVAGGPKLDAHGRARIERGDDIEGFNVYDSSTAGPRSNFRFRYPGAKLVDQLLPFVLVLLSVGVVAKSCFSSEVTPGEQPTPGVATSRLIILLAAYLFIIWPASHIALKMAATKMRFSMPSFAVWRSFAAFTPVLLMGGFLFENSGGSLIPLIMGLLVGSALAVGAVALLFRVFPNEVPTVAGYAAAGSIGGSVFAALVIVAINMVGAAIARMDKSPTLFTSPIAIGLPWVEKTEAPVVAIKPKPPVAPPATKQASEIAKQTTTANTAPTPLATPMQSLPIPQPADGSASFIKLLEMTPVLTGFDEVVLPPVASNVVGIIRNAAGGVFECWDRTTWKQTSSQPARGFDRSQGAIMLNTNGNLVVRIVHTPSDRIEQLPLGNTSIMRPVILKEAANRTIFGFVNENELLVRINDQGTAGFERFELPAGITKDQKRVFSVAGNGLKVETVDRTVRLFPDGSGFLVAGRDPVSNQAKLATYPFESFNNPTDSRDISIGDRFNFRPLGLAASNTGRAALLLDAEGELNLTTWAFDRIVGGVKELAQQRDFIVDRKLGSVGALRPNNWNDESDPLLWLDDNTLLLYGSLVVDATTGITLGQLGVKDVVAQYSAGNGAVLLVQNQNRLNTLLRATIDTTKLAAARK